MGHITPNTSVSRVRRGYMSLALGRANASGTIVTNISTTRNAFLESQAWRHATQVDLRSFTQVRFEAYLGTIPGPAACRMLLRYVTTYSASSGNWKTIGASEVSLLVDGATGYYASDYIDIPKAGRSDVFIDLGSDGGNGTSDPFFGNITAGFR